MGSGSYLTKPRPPFRDVRRKIKALKRLNLRQADIDSLKKELAPLLHHYVHPSPLLQSGERIFRAVPWPARPTHRDELTYPPAQKVNHGRCNRLGEPVFYGSVGSTAAIQELTPIHGVRLALAMWRVTKPIMLASLGYSETAFVKMGSERWSNVWWRQSLGDPEPPAAKNRENMLLDRFLADEFTRKIPKNGEWRYKLSIAIAETFLKAKPAESISGVAIPGVLNAGDSLTGIEVGGVVYPSIATDANDDNVALKCSVADNCLEFVWVHYLEIVRKKDADEFSMKGLDYANQLSSSGEIQWKSTFPNTIAAGTDFHIQMDGIALVMKDSLGRLIGKFGESEESAPANP